MNHYHVCVYAICKNEAKFVPGWIESMREADSIVVLDTGSTDETVRLLEEGGAKVTREIISPWRFDTARNRSLELVPEEADICVCTDLDELLRPGWRALLEAAWKPGTGQATYRYVWNFNEDGSEGVVFWYEKVHARGLYRWIHPVHEVLEYIGEGPRPETVRVEGMQLDHHADPAKSRSQYLPLLELSVRENPGDDRGLHYLGREYLFQRRWDDAIGALTRHLALPSATWEDERCASMRFLRRPAVGRAICSRPVAGFCARREKPPGCGNLGLSWPNSSGSCRSTTQRYGLRARRFRFRSVPRAISAPPKHGAHCRGICSHLDFGTPDAPPKRGKPAGGRLQSLPARTACKKISVLWRKTRNRFRTQTFKNAVLRHRV